MLRRQANAPVYFSKSAQQSKVLSRQRLNFQAGPALQASPGLDRAKTLWQNCRPLALLFWEIWERGSAKILSDPALLVVGGRVLGSGEHVPAASSAYNAVRASPDAARLRLPVLKKQHTTS